MGTRKGQVGAMTVADLALGPQAGHNGGEQVRQGRERLTSPLLMFTRYLLRRMDSGARCSA